MSWVVVAALSGAIGVVAGAFGSHALRTRLAPEMASAWEKTPIVVTSRPAAYRDDAVLAGFERRIIEPLRDKEIHGFVSRWCQELFPDSPDQARRHNEELQDALQSTAQIRRMSSTPVMLSALCVVHWNERRIPEQRAELYDSVLTWLSRAK